MAAPTPAASIVDVRHVHQCKPLLVALERTIERRRRVRGRDEPLAVVLDIDETALLNRGSKVVRNSCVYVFYRKMLDLGVAVFFVTARSDTYRDHTASQLRRLGYDRYVQLHMMPERLHNPATFKRDVRRSIVRAGYHVLANVGDQWTDMDGGYYDLGIKLPEDDGEGATP